MALADPDLGERIPQGEEAAIREVDQLISDSVRHQAKTDGPARRDAHAKAHGCVQAQVEVPAGLPPDLARGVFAKARIYPAWVRFSNGSGKPGHDADGDGRGMSLKLLSDEEGNQDFLMINHPVFFVRNAIDYVAFQKAVIGGKPEDFFSPSKDPRTWRLKEGKIIKELQLKRPRNPLDLHYFSMTPYRLGEQAIKFSARPCAGTRSGPSVMDVLRTPESPDFLSENMAADLEREDACFDLLVQRRTYPKEMPIEDPTEEWSSRKSPWIAVARVSIPSQIFDSAQQMKVCENFSFTPARTRPEHAPLGGINRVRVHVYETISKLRHELNQVERHEPTVREWMEAESLWSK